MGGDTWFLDPYKDETRVGVKVPKPMLGAGVGACSKITFCHTTFSAVRCITCIPSLHVVSQMLNVIVHKTREFLIDAR